MRRRNIEVMKNRNLFIVVSIFSSLLFQAIIAPQKIFDLDVSAYILFSTLLSSVLALHFCGLENKSLKKLTGQLAYGIVFFAVNCSAFILLTENLRNPFSILDKLEMRSTIVVVIFSFAVSACEEIIFRRWLLGALLKRMRSFYAVILSALVFQVAHFTLLPTPFLMGIIAAYLAYRHKSLLGPVLLHLIYDSLWDLGALHVNLDEMGILQAVSMISLCISFVIFLFYILFSSAQDFYINKKEKSENLLLTV